MPFTLLSSHSMSHKTGGPKSDTTQHFLLKVSRTHGSLWCPVIKGSPKPLSTEVIRYRGQSQVWFLSCTDTTTPNFNWFNVTGLRQFCSSVNFQKRVCNQPTYRPINKMYFEDSESCWPCLLSDIDLPPCLPTAARLCTHHGPRTLTVSELCVHKRYATVSKCTHYKIIKIIKKKEQGHYSTDYHFHIIYNMRLTAYVSKKVLTALSKTCPRIHYKPPWMNPLGDEIYIPWCTYDQSIE